VIDYDAEVPVIGRKTIQLTYNRDPVTWPSTAAMNPHLRDADYTAMWSAQFQSKKLRQLIL